MTEREPGGRDSGLREDERAESRGNHDPDEPETGTASPSGAGKRGGGCCVLGLWIALALGALTVLLLPGYLSGLSPREHPVPAPVRSVSRQVSLSAVQPTVTGKVTIRFAHDGSPPGTLSLGVSLGMPRVTGEPSASSQTLFSDPLVRLTLLDQSSETCGGPCELQLDQGACVTLCALVYPIRLELVDGQGFSGGHVEAQVTAAASQYIDRQLPDDLVIDLTFDAPAPSGGS
jgi:hypothetical protein